MRDLRGELYSTRRWTMNLWATTVLGFAALLIQTRRASRPASPGSGLRHRTAASPRRARGLPAGRSPPSREIVVGHARAVRPHRLGHAVEEDAELLLVAALDGLALRRLEVVEAFRDLVVDLELALSIRRTITAAAPLRSPEPTSAFSLASSSSTWLFAADRASSRSSSVGCR